MRAMTLFLSGVVLATAFPAGAAEDAKSPYAGQEKRIIKTLSAKDIDDLINGRGWGLAKAAELNGVPGPSHLLELKDKIGLSPQQVAQIGSLFVTMKDKASGLGRQLVDLEAALNTAFAEGNVEAGWLATMLDKISRVRRDLRYTHLVTHLQTPAILKPEQITHYNKLRGYGGAGDGAAHSPEMMKGHKM
ncbi:MAG: Spy/CpxP family protein refolding chaperone [Alphaproteobacteria bacterium]